jgi:hypothetical protein
MPKTKQTNVMVLVNPDVAGGLKTVAKALRAAGMTGVKVEAAIGTITGSVASPAAFAKLQSIPGVLHVEESADDYQVPPPDSDLQ